MNVMKKNRKKMATVMMLLLLLLVTVQGVHAAQSGFYDALQEKTYSDPRDVVADMQQGRTVIQNIYRVTPEGYVSVKDQYDQEIQALGQFFAQKGATSATQIKALLEMQSNIVEIAALLEQARNSVIAVSRQTIVPVAVDGVPGDTDQDFRVVDIR